MISSSLAYSLFPGLWDRLKLKADFFLTFHVMDML